MYVIGVSVIAVLRVVVLLLVCIVWCVFDLCSCHCRFVAVSFVVVPCVLSVGAACVLCVVWCCLLLVVVDVCRLLLFVAARCCFFDVGSFLFDVCCFVL